MTLSMRAFRFDETPEYRYSGHMRLMRFAAVPISTILMFASCSFNYTEGEGEGKTLPEMVISRAQATRYEDARITMVFSADMLEVYDGDRVWAGEDVSFVEYDSGDAASIAVEGSAGVMLIDDKNEIYSLGNSATFYMKKDDIRLSAPDIKWTKKLNRIAGSELGIVEIREEDGSTIQGAGFTADTLKREFLFSRDVSGSMVLGSGTAEGDSAGGDGPDNGKPSEPGIIPPEETP